MDTARNCIERVLELEPDWEKHIKKYLPDLWPTSIEWT
jgi:hypothetical protein